jgi:FKBP-type peptidyl-prolyl cis-trans isomerase FklB
VFHNTDYSEIRSERCEQRYFLTEGFDLELLLRAPWWPSWLPGLAEFSACQRPVGLAQNAMQWDNRQMPRSLITALLLAAATMLAGAGLAQQTPAGSPAATTPSAPSATTPKAPAKKTATPAKPAAAAPALTTRKQKFSYALGMNIGSGLGANLKKQSVEVDPAILAQGLKDALSGAKLRLTEDEAKAVLTEVQNEVRKQQQEKAAEAATANKKEGEEFLAANKTKEGVVTLPDGLQYKILTEGKGPKPAATDTVVCNYKGTLINGTEFDSSYKRGQPATFGVGQVIKGWTEALQLMPVGSKWQLFIPSSLAYGDHGAGADIGPDATLIFEVDLLSIQEKPKEEMKSDDKAKEEKKDEDKKPNDDKKQ